MKITFRQSLWNAAIVIAVLLTFLFIYEYNVRGDIEKETAEQNATVSYMQKYKAVEKKVLAEGIISYISPDNIITVLAVMESHRDDITLATSASDGHVILLTATKGTGLVNNIYRCRKGGCSREEMYPKAMMMAQRVFDASIDMMYVCTKKDTEARQCNRSQN